MSGADVTFQVVGSKKEEKKVKNVLNKWVDRGFVGNITVAEKDNSIKTPLSIQVSIDWKIRTGCFSPFVIYFSPPFVQPKFPNLAAYFNY